MPSEAPSDRALASFSLLLEVTMTRAPIILANWSAKIDTPPVPWTSTVSPAFTPPRVTRAFHAVSAAQGNVAASSSVRWEGVRITPCRSRVTNSESVPSRSPPSEEAAFSEVSSPSSHSWKNVPMTLSPFVHSVTPSPTAAISPAPSEPGTSGNGMRGL
jgi:hypothetical protein